MGAIASAPHCPVTVASCPVLGQIFHFLIFFSICFPFPWRCLRLTLQKDDLMLANCVRLMIYRKLLKGIGDNWIAIVFWPCNCWASKIWCYQFLEGLFLYSSDACYLEELSRVLDQVLFPPNFYSISCSSIQQRCRPSKDYDDSVRFDCYCSYNRRKPKQTNCIYARQSTELFILEFRYESNLYCALLPNEAIIKQIV